MNHRHPSVNPDYSSRLGVGQRVVRGPLGRLVESEYKITNIVPNLLTNIYRVHFAVRQF